MTSQDLREIIRDELEPVRKQITDLSHLITGNGTPERGIVVRVDRLEQSHHTMSWVQKAIAGAIISVCIGGAAVGAVYLIRVTEHRETARP